MKSLNEPGKSRKNALTVSEGIFRGFHSRRRTNPGPLFPVVLDVLVPVDHVCRVIDAFVGQSGKPVGAFAPEARSAVFDIPTPESVYQSALRWRYRGSLFWGESEGSVIVCEGEGEGEGEIKKNASAGAEAFLRWHMRASTTSGCRSSPW